MNYFTKESTQPSTQTTFKTDYKNLSHDELLKQMQLLERVVSDRTVEPNIDWKNASALLLEMRDFYNIKFSDADKNVQTISSKKGPWWALPSTSNIPTEVQSLMVDYTPPEQILQQQPIINIQPKWITSTVKYVIPGYNSYLYALENDDIIVWKRNKDGKETWLKYRPPWGYSIQTITPEGVKKWEYLTQE